MQRSIFVLFLIAAAGVAVIWLFSSEEADQGPVALTEAAVPDAAQGAGGAVAAVGVEVAVDEVPPADFLRVEVEVDEQPPGRALLVQVWLGEEGMPAPDAEVFVSEGSDEAKAQSEDPFAPHISELGETRGTRFETDAEGRVELPPVQEWVILTARAPGTFGTLTVGRDHAEVESITLRPDETVTVRVVDGRGEPVASAPVGVLQRVPFLAGREKTIARMDELRKTMEQLWERMQASPTQRERGEPQLREMKAEYGRLQRKVGASLLILRPARRTPPSCKCAALLCADTGSGVGSSLNFEATLCQHELSANTKTGRPDRKTGWPSSRRIDRREAPCTRDFSMK